MIKTLAAPALLAAMLALPFPALASGDIAVGEPVAAQIRAKLTEQGYEVRKIRREDDANEMYEAYAVKDGQKFEVYLDKDMNIVRTKIDD